MDIKILHVVNNLFRKTYLPYLQRIYKGRSRYIHSASF